MMEQQERAADTLPSSRTLDPPAAPGNHAERAVSVEFIASLFRNTNDGDTSTASGWNVAFPGLSLQQDGSSTAGAEGHHASKHAAEVHAVTLMARPSNQTLRENAYASFLTLVNARLHAYVRRWPAVASLLQYRIQPMTLLSRLEVLSPTTATASERDEDTAETSSGNVKLAVCCWSMAMDLVLEKPCDATQEGNNDTTRNSLQKSPVISVSFSTLGSISQDTRRAQQLIVDLELQVLLSEMIRQASTVVSSMAKLASAKSLPQPASQTVKRTSSCISMPPPPPRRTKRLSVVVSPDLSSSTAHHRVVPSLHLNDSSLSVDQCADIVDTCLTEFEPVSKRAKLVSTQP